MRAHRLFAAEAESVALARRFTREQLEDWGADELADDAALIVSELLTNAVVHTGTSARLVLGLRGRDLRIEVEDRHPGRVVPMVVGRPPESSEHGRGLMITRSLSSAGGVEYDATSKRVWARCGEGNGAADDTHRVGRADGQQGHGVRLGIAEVSTDGAVTAWNHDAEELLGWSPVEVVGRPFADLLDPAPTGGMPWLPGGSAPGLPWQGSYGVLRKDGSTASVFASHVRAADDKGTILLLVDTEQRGLLEHPAASARGSTPATSTLGLRDDALVKLSVDEYLTLAVERVRDHLAADATYLLLSRDFDDELEVAAVSGLPERLCGTRVEPGSPGTLDEHSPHLPLVLPDLSEHPVPLVAGTDLRSLTVVPLTVEGKVVGALAAASVGYHGFTEDQVVQLQRFADSIAVASDRARLKASERERRGWLSFIADAGDLLAGSLDQEMTMAITGQIVVPRIARWCAIHLNDERGKPILKQVWHEDEELVEKLQAALETLTPAEVARPDTQVGGYAATTIPLVARRRQIGSLTIGRPSGELLRSEFFLVAESIARRAALAIDNARAHGDLQAAGRALQQSLLPATVPTAPGLDVGVVYEPAGEDAAAGGDFYDLFPVGNGKWWFVIGDVCGTGAAAAAVTGLARHTIQALARAGFPPAATLERLNTAILDEGERGRFLTLLCGTLHLEQGRVQLNLINAGHPPPFLLEKDGGVREIGGPQPLLGVVENVAYEPESWVLSRGDLLVAVTDGVLERRDGDRRLGEEPVAKELVHAAHLPAQAVAEQIHRLVVEFSDAPQHDDVAILALRMEMGAP
ncbi:MAG: SpoIIE family protein phosphatase [Nocardioidaceae bacterium]